MAERLTKLAAPIERIVWRNPHELNANAYNPNVVVSREMELLKRSIELTGWIQPALIGPDDTIIDGFHRVTLARLNDWLVPCVVLDLPKSERMLLTIRINRAKGTHVALRMSSIIQTLIADGVSREHIMASIGATAKELELLEAGDVFKAIDLSKWTYSRAWLPRRYSDKGQTSGAAPSGSPSQATETSPPAAVAEPPPAPRASRKRR